MKLSWRSAIVAVVALAALGWFFRWSIERAQRDAAKSTGHCMHAVRSGNDPRCTGGPMLCEKWCMYFGWKHFQPSSGQRTD